MEKTEESSPDFSSPSTIQSRKQSKVYPDLSHPTPTSENEESPSSTKTQAVSKLNGEEREYPTGAKFVITLVSLTLVTFLLLLDVSIVSTVS